MPAGDLIVRPGQLEMRGTLTGVGTVYQLGKDRIGGLGRPEPKIGDQPLGHAAGSYRGRDYADDLQITVTYIIVKELATGAPDPAGAGQAFWALRQLWVESESADIDLHFREWGFGLCKVTGRPRGLVADLRYIDAGVAAALATFTAGPTITVLAP